VEGGTKGGGREIPHGVKKSRNLAKKPPATSKKESKKENQTPKEPED